MADIERTKGNRDAMRNEEHDHGITLIGGIPVSAVDNDHYSADETYASHYVPSSKKIADGIAHTPSLFDNPTPSGVSIFEIMHSKNEQRLHDFTEKDNRLGK